MNKDKRSWKEKWIDFKFRVKVFSWFIFTEPVRQVREIFRLFGKVLNILNKTLTWAYIAIILIAIALIMGDEAIAGLFVAFLVCIVLLWEWQRGYFMHAYREKTRERLREKAEELKREGKKDYDEHIGHDWSVKDDEGEVGENKLEGDKKW